DNTHIHGFEIRDDAPNSKLNKIKDDKNLIQNILQYMDSLITTINSDIN
ncbi:4085_t:CDS:1, partial [Racocetra fulgida]